MPLARKAEAPVTKNIAEIGHIIITGISTPTSSGTNPAAIVAIPAISSARRLRSTKAIRAAAIKPLSAIKNEAAVNAHPMGPP